MNHRAKFDTARFILAGEIRNRTKLQNYKKKQIHKQTVNDISAPCLSACVDNQKKPALTREQTPMPTTLL